MSRSPAAARTKHSKEEALFAALPRLVQEDLIPEINSLKIGADGAVVPKGRPRQRIVTYDYAGRRITARFEGEREEPITMELGCRLIRIPFTIEAPDVRREILRRIYALQERRPGRVGISPQQWLYYRDRMILPAAAMTASWLLTHLTLATLLLDPVIANFAELDLPAFPGVAPSAVA